MPNSLFSDNGDTFTVADETGKLFEVAKTAGTLPIMQSLQKQDIPLPNTEQSHAPTPEPTPAPAAPAGIPTQGYSGVPQVTQVQNSAPSGNPMAGYTPGMQIQNQDQSTVGTTGLDAQGKKTLKGLETKVGAEQKAVQNQGDALVAQNNLVSAQIAQTNLDAQTKLATVQNTQQEQQNKIDTATQKYANSVDAVQNFKFHDFWGERSTGDKALGAIAIALGAFGNGENQGLKMINAQMDHAYLQQKNQFDAAKSGAELQGNVVSKMTTAFHDDQLAKLGFYEAGLKQNLAKIEQYKMATNSPVIKANADKLSAELGVQLGKIQVEAAGKVTTNAQKNTTVSSQTLPQFPGMGSGASPNIAQTMMIIPEGQRAEAAKEAQALDQYNRTREEFDGMYKKAAGYGAGASVSPSERKQIASYDAALTGKIMRLVPGISTAELENFQKNLLPSAYDAFTPEAKGVKLDAMTHFIESYRPPTTILNSYGYRPPPSQAQVAQGNRNKAINAGARPVSNGG